jgi:hypothetical protein
MSDGNAHTGTYYDENLRVIKIIASRPREVTGSGHLDNEL